MENQAKEWNELLESLKNLFTKQSAYHKININIKKIDFSIALNDPMQKVYALHLMTDEEEYIKEFCFQKLVYISASGNAGYLGFARNIIIGMNKEFVEKNIDFAIENCLSIHNIINELDYVLRNIAQLLLSLGFLKKLRSFIELHCKDSENEDINEIYIDYFEKSNWT